MSDRDFSQLEMVHRLPPASLVDRFAYLREVSHNRRVVHVGFVDAGCQQLNEKSKPAPTQRRPVAPLPVAPPAPAVPATAIPGATK